MVRRICGLFARFFRAGARGAWWFPAAFALFYRLVLPSPAARGQRRLIVAAVDETAPILVQAWESFSRPEADIRALAAGLDVPVWFAWSKSDQVARFSLCQLATAAMRRATVTQFKGGHAAFPQQPQAFAAAFERFVAGLLVADPSATAPC
jgi:4,5:9,10-diseco-3-hydroxy-5,9,17-trioxoandrosta-1(10),2-diene-4-oate hydrolase